VEGECAGIQSDAVTQLTGLADKSIFQLGQDDGRRSRVVILALALEQVGVGCRILPTPKSFEIYVTGLGVVGGNVVAPKIGIVRRTAADETPSPCLVEVKVSVRLDVAANRRFSGFDVVGVPLVDTGYTALKGIGALLGPLAVFTPEHNAFLARENRRDGGISIGRDPNVVGGLQP